MLLCVTGCTQKILLLVVNATVLMNMQQQCRARLHVAAMLSSALFVECIQWLC